jgi:hypothetical protein
MWPVPSTVVKALFQINNNNLLRPSTLVLATAQQQLLWREDGPSAGLLVVERALAKQQKCVCLKMGWEC